MAIGWGTNKYSALSRYGFHISIGAFDEMKLSVAGSRKQLVKVVGTATNCKIVPCVS